MPHVRPTTRVTIVAAGMAVMVGLAPVSVATVADTVEVATSVPASAPRCLVVAEATPGDVAVLNITNTGAVGNGWGALRASDAAPVYDRAPADRYASVNFAANTPPNPNLAFTKIGPDNRACYDGAVSSHHVILDLAAVMPASSIDAIDPLRIIDTRGDTPVSPSSSRCFDVSPGASPGDVAVVNITNTGAVGNGWGALRASDAAPVYDRAPADRYASVNFAANTPPNPNLAFTKIGPDNRACYDGAVSSHHVILDLTAIIPGDHIDAIDPVRVLDTRGAAPVVGGSSRCFTVASGASPGDVAVLNITNTGAVGNGWGALRASDAAPVYDRAPADRYASVNFAANTPPNPNLALTRIGPDRRFCYDGAVSNHHVILDLVAFVPASDIDAVEPRRLLDTRSYAELTPWTRVLDAVAAEALTIGPDRIIIPIGHPDAEIQVGDVLVAGVTSTTPSGMLRRVTSTQRTATSVIATTSAATITDALTNAHVDVSAPLEFGHIVSTPGFGRNDLEGGSGTVTRIAPSERDLGGFVISIDEILADQDGDQDTADDQIRLTGTVDVEIDVDLDLDVSFGDLERLAMSLSGSVSSNLQLSAAYADDFGRGPSELFAIEFTPFTIMIPPGFPIVVQPRIPVLLGFDGSVSAAIDTSATVTGFGEVGFEYDDDRGWGAIKTFEIDADVQPPAVDPATNASAQADAEVRFELKVWEGLAAASIGVRASTRVDMRTESPNACVYGILRAPGRLAVLGDEIFDKDLITPLERLLHPSVCAPGDGIPAPGDIDPVPAYAQTFGSCTSDGYPVGEVGLEVIATSDGGVVVAASRSTTFLSDDFAVIPHLWLVRLDAAGDVVWELAYHTSSGRPVGLVDTVDGPVVATEREIVLLDPTGAVRKVWTLGGGTIRGLAAAPDDDGYLVFGGIGTPWLARLGDDGTVRWAREYVVGDGDWAGSVRGASPTAAGGWTVALTDGAVMAVDASGESTGAGWISVDGIRPLQYAMSTAAGPDGQLALGFRRPSYDSVVLRIDSSLDLTAATMFEPRSGSGHHRVDVRSLAWLPDDDLVAAGSVGHGIGDPVGLGYQRFAPSGAIRWAVEYFGDEPYPAYQRTGRAVVTTADGGVVAVGSTWSLAAERCGSTFDRGDAGINNIPWDLWVTKVPSTGLMTPRSGSGLVREGLGLDVLSPGFEVDSRAVTSLPVSVVNDISGPIDIEATGATIASQAP